MTRDDLVQWRLHDEEPFVGVNHYSLFEEDHDPAQYIGTNERRAIRTLDGAIDSVSLVIRYHRSREIAGAYLEALDDSAQVGRVRLGKPKTGSSR
jgi:hypothetical protein